MRLKSITVGNFKNIDVTTLNLDTIIAVISTNNYGKSNLLEAIHFGFDFIAASAKSRSSMMQWIPGIPLSPKLAGKDYIFSIEFDDPDLDEYRYVRYMFQFSWPTDEKKGVIVDETIEMRPNESVRYTSYLQREKGRYRAAKEKNGSRKILLASNVLAVDILSSIDNIGISNVITQIKNLSYKMCRTLDVDPSFHPCPVEFDLGASSPVPFDDEDIPRALSILKKNYPEKYNLFKETIYDLFPEFQSVSLREYELKENEMPKFQAYVVSSDEKKTTEVPCYAAK